MHFTESSGFSYVVPELVEGTLQDHRFNHAVPELVEGTLQNHAASVTRC